MTREEMIKNAEEHEKKKEAYRQGKIKDGMTEEERKNWIEKCNA